jgi:hypothetical protein
VGTQVLNRFYSQTATSLILLGRPIDTIQTDFVHHRNQHFDAATYESFIKNVSVGICTLGVGQTSIMSKEEF